MDNPLTVRGLQRLSDLDPNLQRLVDRQLSFRQPVGNRLAVKILHY